MLEANFTDRASLAAQQQMAELLTEISTELRADRIGSHWRKRLGKSDIATLHGRQALFTVARKIRLVRTLEADCRLANLSWDTPGSTGLIVLADPTLLAVRANNLLGEEPSCFPRTTQFTGRLLP